MQSTSMHKKVITIDQFNELINMGELGFSGDGKLFMFKDEQDDICYEILYVDQDEVMFLEHDQTTS